MYNPYGPKPTMRQRMMSSLFTSKAEKASAEKKQQDLEKIDEQNSNAALKEWIADTRKNKRDKEAIKADEQSAAELSMLINYLQAELPEIKEKNRNETVRMQIAALESRLKNLNKRGGTRKRRKSTLSTLSTFRKSTFEKGGAKSRTRKSTFRKSTFRKSTFRKSTFRKSRAK
jgi:hypothetical protein